MRDAPRLPLKQALLRILIITLAITGSSALVAFYMLVQRQNRQHDDNYRIIAIVQTGPEREALNTAYLAELIGLSVDRPTNLYKFDVQGAEQKLLTSPLIKAAKVQKLPPSAIYIDYTVRRPSAFLIDYENTAMDGERTLFPFRPFFTPKRLPEIYLGLINHNIPIQGKVWGTQVQGKEAELAFDLLNLLTKEYCSNITHLRRIDVSHAYAESYGQRQIIVMMEDIFEKEKDGQVVFCVQPRILRCSADNYVEGLKRFRVLHAYLMEQEQQQAIDPTQKVFRAEPMIIDLRIPHLAFIKEN